LILTAIRLSENVSASEAVQLTEDVAMSQTVQLPEDIAVSQTVKLAKDVPVAQTVKLSGHTGAKRLNIELDLQSLFGLLCNPRNPPPLWAHDIRGHYWSAKIDILCNPLYRFLTALMRRSNFVRARKWAVPA
jgi:hypothetical protein